MLEKLTRLQLITSGYPQGLDIAVHWNRLVHVHTLKLCPAPANLQFLQQLTQLCTLHLKTLDGLRTDGFASFAKLPKLSNFELQDAKQLTKQHLQDMCSAPVLTKLTLDRVTFSNKLFKIHGPCAVVRQLKPNLDFKLVETSLFDGVDYNYWC